MLFLYLERLKKNTDYNDKKLEIWVYKQSSLHCSLACLHFDAR